MKRILATLATLTIMMNIAGAQEKSAEEIAAELANPNTAMATLNFKNQFTIFKGDLPGAGDQDNYKLLLQPVFPFPLEDGSKIIFRPGLSLIDSQPIPDAEKGGFRNESGISDLGFDLAFAPKVDPGKLFAVGLVGSAPTGSDDLGNDLWSAGPELLFGKLTPKYVAGGLLTHQWDYAGSGDGSVNLSSLQYFYTYLPGGGWNIGTGPTLSYDWKNEQWTVPFQLNAGKTVILGSTPWKIGAEVNYFAEQNDALGSEWLFGINISPVIANPFVGLFK